MTDYNYDQHRATLDGSDRSRNTATNLSGYSIQIKPESDWPGLERNPREQRFDKDAMIGVTDAIKGLVAELGTIDLTSAGSVSFGPDSWQAAVYLREASGQVARTVNTYAQELIRNLEQATANIRAAAINYGGAENANTAAVTAVDNNLAASPAPSGTTPDAW